MAADPRSDRQKEREQALRSFEDQIGQGLRDSEASGELRSAPSWGRPLAFGDGWDETPPELRMAMKVLKDAGVVPPEVEWMREAAALQAELEACTDEVSRQALRERLSLKRQAIALRLESLAKSRTL